MQYKEECCYDLIETSARPERKRMTNHNTPQLSGMDSANHCAGFLGLSALSTTTIYLQSSITALLATKSNEFGDENTLSYCKVTCSMQIVRDKVLNTRMKERG
jgi:hypothetical protein